MATREEQETIIRVDYYAEKVNFYTTSKRTRDSVERRLQAAFDAGLIEEEVSRVEGEEVGWDLTIPRELFRGPKMAFVTGTTLASRVEELTAAE